MHPVNIVIHIGLTPIFLITILNFLQFDNGISATEPNPIVIFNCSWAMTLGLMVIYTSLHFKVGLIFTGLLTVMTVLSRWMYVCMGESEYLGSFWRGSTQLFIVSIVGMVGASLYFETYGADGSDKRWNALMGPLMCMIHVCEIFGIYLNEQTLQEIESKTLQKMRELREKKLKDQLPPLEERLNKATEEELERRAGKKKR